MAGDWMKMRTNLWDDPRVARIVDLTDSCEALVIGGLYWLWSMADQHTEDGWLPGMSLRQIDRKSGVPGLGEALSDIGWLEAKPDGVLIVRFDDHNGKSAKKRCQTASRVAKHKAGNASGGPESRTGNANSVTESVPGRYLEKRREEKSSTPDTSLHASEIPEGMTAAGWAGVLMKRAGCHTASASHPDLIEAVEVEGVPFQMLVDLVEEGRARAPPPKNLFTWAIAAARGRHAEGAKPVNLSNGSNHGTRRLSPAERTAQLALEGELADAADAAAFTGTGHGYADALGANG